MKKLFLIGNLTADPVMRTTVTGVPVCTFTVAANYRAGGETKTDYYRVSAWRGLGQSCANYLKKGSRVSVIGDLSLGTYTGRDGKTYIHAEVSADIVEFLGSPRQADGGSVKGDAAPMSAASPTEPMEGTPLSGFENVDDSELPFD